jgi:hypothetical protein
MFNPHSPSTNFKQHGCTVLDCGESESWCHMSEEVMHRYIIVLEQNLCGGISLVSSVIRCCQLEFFAECFSPWVQLLCSLCALLPQAGEWCFLFFVTPSVTDLFVHFALSYNTVLLSLYLELICQLTTGGSLLFLRLSVHDAVSGQQPSLFLLFP